MYVVTKVNDQELEPKAQLLFVTTSNVVTNFEFEMLVYSRP